MIKEFKERGLVALADKLRSFDDKCYAKVKAAEPEVKAKKSMAEIIATAQQRKAGRAATASAGWASPTGAPRAPATRSRAKPKEEAVVVLAGSMSPQEVSWDDMDWGEPPPADEDDDDFWDPAEDD